MTLEGRVAIVTGASRGIGTTIAERFTTGLAAEVYADGIPVNVVSPSGLVATPGVVHHGLDRNLPAELLEPVEVVAAAAYVLCTGDPSTLTGRVTYAKPILDELGVPVPSWVR